LATAIKSVEGVKVLTAPGKGSGEHGLSIAVVEIGGKATISSVSAAIEKAKTPHSAKMPPAVVGVLPFKVKASATPESLHEALKKADLIDE
jgi:hypothetical protein